MSLEVAVMTTHCHTQMMRHLPIVCFFIQFWNQVTHQDEECRRGINWPKFTCFSIFLGLIPFFSFFFKLKKKQTRNSSSNSLDQSQEADPTDIN
jgi:hypothetical protein